MGKVLDAIHHKRECEANAFARYLLVPDSLLEKELRRKKYDLSNDKDLKELAEIFKVPMGIMGIRLGEFITSNRQ